MVDVDFSDDEGMELKEAMEVRLEFGKHKGKEIGSIVATKNGREYLRYLQKWDELRWDTKAAIDTVLKEYKILSDVQKIKK